MKSSPRLSLIAQICSLIILCTTSAFAFEGKIDMKMSAAQHEGEMPITYFVKGNKLRYEITPPANDKRRKGRESGTMAVIFNYETREMIMLMSQQNMYMVHKIQDPTTTASPNGSSAAPNETAKDRPEHQKMDFKPTGRKETIAGVPAEEYVGVSEGKQVEMWVTKGMGKFVMANQGSARGGPAATSGWEKFMRESDFFPLRVITREKEGGPEKSRMEVTNIDRTSPPDSLFAPPPEYKKFEMPNIGDALRGMVPGGDH